MNTRKFVIECEIPERWVDDFCSFIKNLEYNGKIGHSSLIGFYADGDGDFRPSFKINTEYIQSEGCNTSHIPEIMYDAG